MFRENAINCKAVSSPTFLGKSQLCLSILTVMYISNIILNYVANTLYVLYSENLAGHLNAYYLIQKNCCEELNFLKLIKDLQAPIEVSTYDRIHNILEFGKYYIGSKDFKIFNSIEEIIKLKVNNNSSPKKKYTFNELQELESKIVLIRDHKPSTDKLSSDKIEYFLNVRFVCSCLYTYIHVYIIHDAHICDQI